jgi:periplasmic protein TonB
MAPEMRRGMLAQGAGWARRFQAVALLALAACTAPPPPVLEPQVFLRVPQAAAQAPEVALSSARTAAEYGHQVAELLHAANIPGVFPGRPPNPLRAVIVVYVEVNRGGELVRLELYRAPDHSPELVDEVERAWRRLGPQLPRPLPALMNGDERLAFTQTWLFDDDGRFRLRALSLPQEELAADEEV